MSPLERRFCALSWEILEHRCRYYVLASPTLDDPAYDALEDEYEALAALLGVRAYASDMVGFDRTRPSCLLVLAKLTGLGV